ncbi:integrator complex subunit 6 [Sitodiplosis mosellana]|uniref:integrator complex subunit 6 n=1 Tax=Sitodiplosis mosellana TaxID=263140 RepID=UPI002444F9ED|nr:integrator complex subunit 6 [Sitodiplosis mosellana]XP_055297454.1 integrator complex subunit 6 [Sitodiplosis mosellana]XP_055297456.1 integrator complex subunit 6 [Sitodiplosis mosellana]XP_055297457.1 integrator complex subunit 6 [Sitodiplosis mosellana]XP_055297458.1 integrator complex subunit 6 [Sitodiplosis mosellana]XP_055297459.1 integrator complex subunit 6 [Sitodiplosis mosellana]XP_055297460.1 integrator complex subunit 6 [Sitodiplosis mosellana]
MTIILFLIDTSASMCQKAYVNGVQKTYLDIAKGAVETFLKYRQRSQDCMGDRYMLLTFEDPPCNVKAGWKENHFTFINELKNLQSNGLTSMGEALKNAFDLLNLNRMQSGIDTYGQGRCPFYLEPSVIIVITDGGRYSYKNGVHQEIIMNQYTGMKLTKEPFRWDQRLFSLVLRMAGNKVDERVEGKVPHDDSPIERMCEVTGGRSYRIKSQYVLNQCIESLVQKVQPGVVVQFEQLLAKDLKDGEVQDLAFQTTKKMIYVAKHPTQKNQFPVGFWPIPEPYWPDPKLANLPPRDAHPKIRIITPCVDEPPMVRNFPVDKYEVEASPLTLQILSKREANKCWPVVISNGNYTLEQPFGYLKTCPPFTQVFLIILPYNYPSLLPLVNELLHKYNSSPPPDWTYKFSVYLRQTPPYYAPFLRRALNTANVPYNFLQYILPENLDNYLSPSVANFLKTIKNTAKQEQENMCLRVLKQLKMPKPPYHQVETAKLNCGLSLKRDLVTHPQLRETFVKVHSEITLFENYTIVVPTANEQGPAKNYRNPFDIPRHDLIDEIARMRENFYKIPTSNISIASKDFGHCLPISEMGNYQEYLKNKETPLREIEPTNVRQHMFGNPYKKDKHMVMVDEADLGEVIMKPNANPSLTKKAVEVINRKRKRQPGPIRKDFVFRRLSTDSYSSAVSNDSNSDMDDSRSIASETSSFADNDENELTIDLGFNQPSVLEEDFMVNGHVQSFINGENSDDSDDVIIQPQPPIHTPIIVNHPISLPAVTTTAAPGLVPPILINAPYNINQQMPSPIQITQAPIQISINQTYASPLSQQNGSTPQVVQVVAPVQPTHAQAHNDLNDAQEISKILQQCHNGSSSNSSVSNSNSNSNNISISNSNTSNPISHGNSNSSSSNNNNTSNGNSGILFEPISSSHLNQKTSSSSSSSSTSSSSNRDTAPIYRGDFELPPNPFGTSIVSHLTHNHHTNNLDNTSSTHNKKNDVQSNNNSTTNNNVKTEDDPQSRLENDDELKETIREHNLQARKIIFQDIRRPGRDYSQLLEHLDLIKGNLETKLQFIQMCIEESQRFRRKKMADCIQEWFDKYVDQ